MIDECETEGLPSDTDPAVVEAAKYFISLFTIVINPDPVGTGFRGYSVNMKDLHVKSETIAGCAQSIRMAQLIAVANLLAEGKRPPLMVASEMVNSEPLKIAGERACDKRLGAIPGGANA